MNAPSPTVIDAVSIRSMKPEDLQQVQMIDRLSFSLPWPASAYEYELNENPLSLLWVAETATPGNGNQVIGMIVAWLVVDEMHIATIAVLPEYRGRGIARRLLLTAFQAAVQRGFRTATLEVRAGNTTAQRLYRQLGFETVGCRPRYYRDNNDDALIMTLHNLDQAYLTQLETNAGQSISGVSE